MVGRGHRDAGDDSDSLCGYLTAAELERILTEDALPGGCAAHVRVSTSCVALLTPQSSNLLLVGQA